MKTIILLGSLLLSGCAGTNLYYAGGASNNELNEINTHLEVGLLQKNIRVSGEYVYMVDSGEVDKRIKVSYIKKIRF